MRKVTQHPPPFDDETAARVRHAQRRETIGTLAEGIVHDFNNILTAILGYAELASTEVPPGGPVHIYLEKVLRAGRRGADLVGHMRTFSSQTDQERRPTPLGATIDGALGLLRASLPPNIHIVRRLEPDAPLVMADPSQIHQVVMNLGTNAWHAMDPHGGTLEVSFDPVDVTPQYCRDHPGVTPGPHARLLVRDSGCGMDSATKERIFDPYFTTKATTEGTGLGLSIVRNIVQSHGGAIVVASKPNKGAQFAVLLPATP